jgi:hypothetical protein
MERTCQTEVQPDEDEGAVSSENGNVGHCGAVEAAGDSDPAGDAVVGGCDDVAEDVAGGLEVVDVVADAVAEAVADAAVDAVG